MKNLKKALVLFLCAVLLVAGSVAGTLAYLQSHTGAVKNTFTVGDLEITLDEAKTNEYGELLYKKDGGYTTIEAEGNGLADRVTANEYKLVPGHLYTKDPTVHVQSSSEPCWVFVEVIDALVAAEDNVTIADQMRGKGWVNLSGNVWYYNGIVDARTAAQNLIVFESFRLKGNVDLSGYATAQNANSVVQITAFAVQADGFNTAADAWNATYGAPANP